MYRVRCQGGWRWHRHVGRRGLYWDLAYLSCIHAAGVAAGRSLPCRGHHHGRGGSGTRCVHALGKGSRGRAAVPQLPAAVPCQPRTRAFPRAPRWDAAPARCSRGEALPHVPCATVPLLCRCSGLVFGGRPTAGVRAATQGSFREAEKVSGRGAGRLVLAVAACRERGGLWPGLHDWGPVLPGQSSLAPGADLHPGLASVGLVCQLTVVLDEVFVHAGPAHGVIAVLWCKMLSSGE